MSHPSKARGNRRIVIFAPPGAFSLDVLGSYEIFVAAARLLAVRRHPDVSDFRGLESIDRHELPYEVQIAAERTGSIETLSGARLCADIALAKVRGPIDTLVVAGGDISRISEAFARDPTLRAALRRVARRARRVASVCTGSFALAAAGLLEGRAATTHWAACDLLQAQYPRVRVTRGPIAVQDGNVYTSAGATTGMDLTLGFIREDHGSEIAREIARWLVLYVERPPGQEQLSVPLRGRGSERKPLRDLQLWIVDHLQSDLSVEVLAEHVGMSIRNFARTFKRELSTTPATFVEGIRVEAALRKLELGTESLATIAAEVGFGSVDTMRRAFVRHTGQLPSDRRARPPARATTP